MGLLAIAACVPVASVRAEGNTTIDGQFAGIGKIGPNGVVTLTVLGRGGVRGYSVEAVAINVTVTNPSRSSFLTVWPTGEDRPTASNLNFEALQTTPNMAIAKVGSSGQISLFNFDGTVDIIVDVLGYFPVGGSYTALTPARLLETRPGYPTVDDQFAGTGAVSAGQIANVTVAGRAGLPLSGVGAVALNVTATGSTATSFLIVWPTGTDRPPTSNLNFTVGQTTPNMVIAKLGSNGQVSVANFVGSVDVVIDVLGWFPTGGAYTAVTPARLLETRPGLPTVDGNYAAGGPLGADGTLSIAVTGRGGVPSSGVSAVVVNVTATGASAKSFLTVWPTGASRPNASNLNFRERQTTPNMVIASVGAGGQISLYNLAGTVDVVVDVLGWFPIGDSYTALTPARLLETRPCVGCLPIPPPAPPPPSPSPKPFVLLPGTHVLNPSIPTGTYLAPNAGSGCYWERLSGLGGSLGEIIANDVQDFAGRAIVEIRATDVAFFSSPSCGAFETNTWLLSLSFAIAPGAHVVGQHIRAGTYTTNAAAGCYWERLSSFDGALEAIIANDFVSTAGSVAVTISPTDEGFRSNAGCGSWAPNFL
jgi:hypothetical protein